MWWLWAWSHAAAISHGLPSATCCEPRAQDARAGQSQSTHADTPPYPTGDTGPRTEKSPSRTSADPVITPTGPKVLLRDEDVVRALEARQETFLRCYRLAQKKDILLTATSVVLHVEVGLTGAVDQVRIEGGASAPLDQCLTAVASHLTFAPPVQPVEAQLKLFFTP